MNIIDKTLQEYVESKTSKEPPLLQRLNRDTHANVLMPRMLSGHVQGRFLSMVSKMVKPKRILEIGTYTGYSAICLAEGMRENSLLYTIDINEELEEMARKYFKLAHIDQQIKLLIGDAAALIPKINEKFDLVFIDADKENYCLYYQLILDKLNPGGYLLADNVLWDGKVLPNERKKIDEDTKGLIAFNDMVQNDVRVENILVPIRDGLMLIRKLD